MAKSQNQANSTDRASKRDARRSTGANGEPIPYKMRSAASRRAEARARAAYRGAEDGLSGALPDAPEPRIAVRDVGIRINLDAPPPHRKAPELDHERVAFLLHNPTKTVSPDVLRAQYTYVANDIRSMVVLTAGLFALLIALALILPQ